MGKGSVFVVVYSFILIALFGIFCYLMTTVNPPPLKPDTVQSRKFETINDEVLYPNEILQPNDNVAYGLEKIDYDTIEVQDKLSNLSEYRRSDVPKIIYVPKTTRKTTKTSNSSRKENKKYKMTTGKKKFSKGFRRSIREKPNVYNSKLLSLLLNIKLLNGQPRVEIKVLDTRNEDKSKESQEFLNKMSKIKISGNVHNDHRNVRELRENETLSVQVVGNLTDLNETCGLNVTKGNVCREGDEPVSELVVEIVNSSETNNEHVLDFPSNSKTYINITTKSDKFSIVKEKYGINVTTAVPSKLNYFNISTLKT